MSHLIVAPIVLPLLAAAVMLLLESRRLKAAIGCATMAALVVVAGVLMWQAQRAQGAAVYLLGDWRAPFGIVLVADRLSSLMVALTSVLAFAGLLFSVGRWDGAGPRFHPLMMILVMGVNGAFLTGDLFNLFVFFEVLLAASYGLALHGSGPDRIKAGLHYIAINLTASLLFLIGASLIYATAGTLNMADLAHRLPGVATGDLPLLRIGCAALGVAFLVKSAMWPLGFWLAPTYSAASAPAAALFAIMTKVGVYVVIRLTALLAASGPLAGFGSGLLVAGGLATLVFGAAGVLAARRPVSVASFSVLVSSGTVLAVVGLSGQAPLSGALFYMVGSTLAIGAFFLLVELLNRARGAAAPAVTEPVFADDEFDPFQDDRGDEEVSAPIPAALGLLSVGFLICTLLLVGLPPLAGFIGKLAIMTGLFRASPDGPAWPAWLLIAALALSSLCTLIAMLRIGVDVLWAKGDELAPRIRRVEFAAIAGLLAVCVAVSILGGPAMRYMNQTARWLNAPQDYVAAVLGQQPAARAGDEVAP